MHGIRLALLCLTNLSLSTIHAFQNFPPPKSSTTTTFLRQHQTKGSKVSRILFSSSLEQGHSDEVSRRDLLLQSPIALSALALSPFALPSPASAESTSTTTKSPFNEFLLSLGGIPTFSIVDENGVPFMIFDGKASATGYFFLSFDIAKQALDDARQKDKGSDIWSKAKIVVVPLSVALQLGIRKQQRQATNYDLLFNTYNSIVASPEGTADARIVDEKNNPDKWNQKGRIPIFTIDGMALNNGKQPAFFNTDDLLKEWRRENPSEPEDTMVLVQVRELETAVRVSSQKNDFAELQRLQIMPVQETTDVARRLVSSEKLPKYDFQKVVLVKTASG